MSDDRKQKLIAFGADALTEVLLDLSQHSDKADDPIERMIATPMENVQRFKKKLSSLKRSRRFIDWRGASSFSDWIDINHHEAFKKQLIQTHARKRSFWSRYEVKK